MAPEVLSLKMFEIGEAGSLSNSDIVDRYAQADVYSFSLISWLILSQCDELWTSKEDFKTLNYCQCIKLCMLSMD